jgi:hypothetical protein
MSRKGNCSAIVLEIRAGDDESHFVDFEKLNCRQALCQGTTSVVPKMSSNE